MNCFPFPFCFFSGFLFFGYGSLSRVPFISLKKTRIMQKNKFHSCLQIVPLLLFMAFVSASCIKDDLSQCEKPAFSLQVRAYDADNRPLGPDVVKDVTLYIFDKNKLFLGTQDIRVNETVTADFPGHESLTLVAWGNGGQGHQTKPALRQGDHLETAFVSLIHTRTSLPVAGSPDDLLHGIIDISSGDTSVEELPMRRMTGSVAITARHLRQYAGSGEGEFRYVLRKSTDKLDFYGKPNGSEVCYSPEAAFDANDDFVSSIFHVFPPEHDIRIDIYHRDVLMTTVISDSKGNPLRVETGRLLNVLIDFRGDISVDMIVSEWGKKEIWKEF